MMDVRIQAGRWRGQVNPLSYSTPRSDEEGFSHKLAEPMLTRKASSESIR